MFQSGVEERLRDEYEEDGYLRPAYDSFCFANVPHTVASMLGTETGRTLPDEAFAGLETDVETVLVVLIDGLGLNRWRSERDVPLLERLTERGTVTPLTSVYPSETAAAMTSYHTGTLPAEHGVIGWNVYEPTVGESFEALPFVTKDGRQPGLEPESVADADPWVAQLDSAVDVHYVTGFPQHQQYATIHEYEPIEALGPTLEGALTATEDGSPSYVFAYVPHLDAAAHEHGTASGPYRETLEEVSAQLERAFDGVDAETAAETLLVVTADHGHLDTDPERNVDLTEIEVLEESLARDPAGEPIRYAGSPRNVHLHLQEGTVENVRETLTSRLEARVYRRERLLEMDLFGDRSPSATLERRIGDLVVVPRDLGVWYGGEHEPEELDLVGMHGGLSPAEMLVPFAVARLHDVGQYK
ncbi:alkaline phosphatase family protein [Halopiger goleimassiliensis]|uniref:alkaline phosphatase family protein n=1 Tax=Halopiger goleimassiliensis TaxID=1293048 RepID=UPI0006780E67|nr:nucleotide pyrophosphatase/phosphodiesterase family protein [Halopiger goleimassiliensis]